MAAFLTRALGLPSAGERFRDVGSDDTFAAEIGAIGAAGITKGCDPPDNDRFCPDELVTRGQMAAFLVRAGLVEPTNQAEADLQFDIGLITAVFVADGRRWLLFDRFRDADASGGPDWTEPPSAVGTTDLQFFSEDPRLRSYRLAPSARVLQLKNLDDVCGVPDGAEPEWDAVGTDFLSVPDADGFFTLTFDGDGDVVEVRDTRGC